jgi:uncharacterized membrane protein YtjA (UPF0391 family)
MFNTAITSLIVAVLAAVLSYGGLSNATAAATALHVYFGAIGLFFVCAMVAILDIESLYSVRTLLGRSERIDLANSMEPGMSQQRVVQWVRADLPAPRRSIGGDRS